MAQQNYSNHSKYYAPHHFIFYPILLIAIVLSARCIFHYPDQACIWTAITGLFVMLGWLSFMLRQHYALGNQNRIIRLEMRLRYYQLTTERFEKLEDRLSFRQIAALRFAPDAELLPLIDRTLSENLSPKDIKSSIRNWQGDYVRV